MAPGRGAVPAVVAGLGGVAAATAAFLPWVARSAPGLGLPEGSLAGTAPGFLDGWITFGSGATAAVAAVVIVLAASRPPLRRWVAAAAFAAGLVVSAIGIYDLVLLTRARGGFAAFGGSVSAGIGLWITIAGGIMAVLGGGLSLAAGGGEP